MTAPAGASVLAREARDAARIAELTERVEALEKALREAHRIADERLVEDPDTAADSAALGQIRSMARRAALESPCPTT